MDTKEPSPEMSTRGAWLRQVRALRRFSGAPNDFWPRCLELMAQGIGGVEASALAVPADDARTRWRLLWEWRPAGSAEAKQAVLRQALNHAREAFESPEGVAQGPVGGGGVQVWYGAISLETGTDQPAVALFLLKCRDSRSAGEALEEAPLLSDLASSYARERELEQVRRDFGALQSTLDLFVWLDVESSLQAAAFRLCNELAARLKCERVSLSWREGPYLRLRAISHLEKFERKMTIVQRLEAAMEEAADQDIEIVYPPAGEADWITRDHQLYFEEEKSGHLCTVPLRLTTAGSDGQAVGSTSLGALTCERVAGPFSEQELRHLRLISDHAARQLRRLEDAELWWWQRARRDFKVRLKHWLGPRHTGAKAVAIGGAVFMLWALVWPLSFAVKGPFALRGADNAMVSAPFDGFLASAKAEKGDQVKPGDILASLDRTELALELGSASADTTRYEAEAQQARAQQKLADMQVALARAEQARARLEIVRRRLEQSDLKAPFAGVVVEGDLRERIGAPVKLGDALFRLAKLDRMYAEILVSEPDIQFVREGALGELAFASRPGETFVIRVERVEPLAQTRPEGNVFIVRCSLPVEVQTWWRPGMSGVAKLEAGRKTPFWQATRKTFDTLRLRWW